MEKVFTIQGEWCKMFSECGERLGDSEDCYAVHKTKLLKQQGLWQRDISEIPVFGILLISG